MLRNKNIVITGAARGIGRALVEECARNGANVWACVRDVSRDSVSWMEETSSRYGVFIRPVKLDLADESSVRSAVSAVLDEKLSVDGIVNNAGITGGTNLLAMTEMKDLRQTFEINFFGPVLFTQRFLKRLIRQKGGSIVFISSMAAADGEPGPFGYVSSKAALNGAVRKLSLELGRFGIRVNAVAPGLTDTSMLGGMDATLKDRTLQRTALGRPAAPEEIAGICAFLLSGGSSYVTGQIINVDGGGI